MPRLNVPPTKSHLLQVKRELGFAREGFDMLEHKREILMLELMGTVESAKRSQQEVQERMARAFQAMREALIRLGTFRLSADAAAPRPAPSVEVESRSLMGIHLPHVSGEHPVPAPAVSLLAGSSALDEATRRFQEALEGIDRLAEIENAVVRLAREVRKTQRRVNALEKVFLPSYEETINYISGVLEERERDEFVIMRRVKERVEERRPRSGAGPRAPIRKG
jgi:V/A-type H+-transporting ATPase subunit D